MSMTGQNLFVRPVAAVAAGGDGASYERAWRGWGAIEWARVRPGDTLWVCGEHLWQRDWRYNRGYENRVQVSGEPGRPVVIRGDWPGDPGVMIGAEQVEAAAFVRDGECWSAPFARVTGGGEECLAAWLGDPRDAPAMLMLAESESDCRERPGTFFHANSRLLAHPDGPMRDFYGRFLACLMVNGSDHIEIRNLRMFGGSKGIVQLVTSIGAPATDIAIIGCELAFADYAAVYASGSTDQVLIEDTRIHHCVTGTYPIAAGGARHSRWTMRRVEVHDGGVYRHAQRADLHALGGQDMSGLLIEDCYVHDWPGDGVINYLARGPINDVTVRGCRFINLRDPAGINYHFGVAKHGTNAMFSYYPHDGWLIENNIFSGLQQNPASTAGSGFAVRVKGGATARGNTFHDCGGVMSVAPKGEVIEEGNRVVEGEADFRPAPEPPPAPWEKYEMRVAGGRVEIVELRKAP